MKTKKTLRYFATVVMASLLLTSFIAKAQTHVYKEGTSSGMFIDGDGAEVANPVSDAVNATPNCARSGTGGWKKIEYFPNFSPASGSKLYFSVYNPNNAGPGQVQFEYTTGGGWKWGGNVEYVSGSNTGWKEYSINLSSHVGNTINKIIVFASGGSNTATYIDNVYFGTASLQPEEAVVYNETISSGIFFQGNGTQVANPVSTFVNSSATCAASGTTGSWQQIQYFPSYTPVSGNKLFFSIYNPNNAVEGQIQFEYTTTGGWQFGGNVTYVSGSTTGWQEYSIDLSSHVGNTINKIIIMPAGGSSSAVYVDNIYFGSTSTLAQQPIVYNETISSGMFIDGDGSQVANPVSDFVNSTANCAKSGTGGWKKIEFFPTFSPASGSKLYFSVYNPNNAGPGQVQFEYTTGGGWKWGGNVEYVSGSLTGWAEYSIDLDSHVGNTINKIILFASGGSSSAVYVDNVYFGTTSTLPQQPVVYNETISSGMFIDGDGSQVANPVSDFVNSTANCAKSGTGGWKKIEYFPTFSPASGSKLYFSVYNPNNAGPGQVQFEYTTGGGWKWGGNVEYVSGSLTGWAEYSIDLASHVGNTINKIILFASGGSSSAVYVDNVYFGTTSTLPQQPVVYNEVISSGIFFQGNGSQVSNPVSTLLNSSANCAASGTTGSWQQIQYFPTYTPVSGNKLFFSVYNPNNAGPGQIQFEYTTGGGWQFGSNVTYVSGSTTGWKEYSIDLSSHAGNTINKIIMMPAGDSSSAVYVDNVYFGNASTLPVSQIPTSALSFCKGATVASAVGTTSLKFYTAVTGGTALSSTSALSTRTLFATEMIGAAESTPRVAVSIIVNALPTQAIGTITSNTAGTTAGTFAAATVAVGPFVGTATTVSYRVPAFTSSDVYFWTVPAGVRIVGQAEGVRTVTQTGANGNVLNVNYSGIAAGVGSVGAITVQAQNSNGCNGTAKSITLTKALPLAPAAITMHDLSLPLPTSGIPTAVRSFAKYMGTNAVLRLTATPSVAATSYEWNLPAGVNQLSGGTTNVITVNFAGVTSGNTFNFDSTAAIPVSTNSLRIGVKSVNGVGTSTTANTALVNPTTVSTAKLLTLTAVRPASPTLKMFDTAVSTTVAVTDISRYIGTNTPLTLVGTVSATTLASSFSWELADGVNVVSGSLTSNSIVVNFEDVAPGTTALYVGIKAVNGMGASVKNNGSLLPAASSTASLLKLSAGLPSAAGTVVGLLAICSNQASSVTYTITAAAAKTSLYVITAPLGTTITGGVMNTRTINAVAGATFTVNYPNGFTSVRPTQKTISIQSVNGFGVSATNKVLTLTSNTCTITSRTTAKVAPIAQEFKVIAYPNPSSGVFNLAIESSKASATTIQVYDMQGRMIESKQVNTNALEIGANYTSGIYNVILENAGQAKTIRLIKK